ncbi:unnamed protein product [Choristocarpus tenellus]
MGCNQSAQTSGVDLKGKCGIEEGECRPSISGREIASSMTSNLSNVYLERMLEEKNAVMEGKSRPQCALTKMGFGNEKPHLAVGWTEGDSANEDIQIHTPFNLTLADIDVKHHIADGGFCALYACLYRGNDVAVKVPRSSCSDVRCAIESVRNEIEIFKRLQHKYLCGFYGAGQGSDDQPFIVLEELQRNLAELCGTDAPQDEAPLRKMIKRKSLKRQLPFRRRLELGLELAEVLKYLHEDAIPGGCVLHRDLKPKNVGLSHDGHIKLFDLGLAKVVESRSSINDKYEMTPETGSQRYMAPEVFKGELYNEKVDMFSYGLILWEMVSLNQAFSSMSTAEHTQKVVEGGLRPALDNSWADELQEILNGCWQRESDQRITASATVIKLTCLLKISDS